MINFKKFGKNYVWKTMAVTGVLALLLAVTGFVSAPSADARDRGIVIPSILLLQGPQFSLDIEAFCGDPVAVRLDEEGNVIETFNDNVAVVLTDVSDDNGPVDPQIDLLTVECLAAVKEGRGRPNQVNFATISIPAPGFGVIDVTCPLRLLPFGATEWKARAVASDGDLRRDVSDNCEEVPVP